MQKKKQKQKQKQNKTKQNKQTHTLLNLLSSSDQNQGQKVHILTQKGKATVLTFHSLSPLSTPRNIRETLRPQGRSQG